MPIPESSARSYAYLYCASIETIRSFLASHGSRRDSETFWLLDVRTPTNLTDSFFSSQNTKRSVLEAEWQAEPSGPGQIRPVFDRTEKDKDRTGQGRTGQDEDRRDLV